MSFLQTFYKILLEIRNNVQMADVSKFLNVLKLIEYSEALEYIIFPLDSFQKEYERSENLYFEDKLFQIKIFIILELLGICLLIAIYFFNSLRPLKDRLIVARKLFFHIPYSLLSQQVRITKYITETGNQILKN